MTAKIKSPQTNRTLTSNGIWVSNDAFQLPLGQGKTSDNLSISEIEQLRERGLLPSDVQQDVDKLFSSISNLATGAYLGRAMRSIIQPYREIGRLGRLLDVNGRQIRAMQSMQLGRLVDVSGRQIRAMQSMQLGRLVDVSGRQIRAMQSMQLGRLLDVSGSLLGGRTSESPNWMLPPYGDESGKNLEFYLKHAGWDNSYPVIDESVKEDQHPWVIWDINENNPYHAAKEAMAGLEHRLTHITGKRSFKPAIDNYPFNKNVKRLLYYIADIRDSAAHNPERYSYLSRLYHVFLIFAISEVHYIIDIRHPIKDGIPDGAIHQPPHNHRLPPASR